MKREVKGYRVERPQDQKLSFRTAFVCRRFTLAVFSQHEEQMGGSLMDVNCKLSIFDVTVCAHPHIEVDDPGVGSLDRFTAFIARGLEFHVLKQRTA